MTTLVVEPLAAPPDASVSVPGSKSITNRALVAAALADGESTLDGILRADDTEAMLDSLARLGAELEVHGTTVRVTGTGGTVPVATADLDARLSGTTSRFLLPLLALGAGRYRLDGAPPLRTRPLAPLLDALRSLGATVEGDRLPVTVGGPVRGGRVAVPGDVSSQFLSGLLLAGPAMPDGLTVELTTELVSKPYVTMTTAVMEAFGASVDGFTVAPGGYRGRAYAVEPDASAASYFFAAAAITGGRVTVPGLGTGSLQGDLAFVGVLAAMGATVVTTATATTVQGGPLHGVDVDLADLSDTAQTLAAVAVFADSPTRVRGIGFVRGKETDRIAAVVTELRRCGVDAEATEDGYVVRPGAEPRPAVVQTYDDHRMAMSFALLGLRVPGIEIDQPEVVAKTFPGYWDAVDRLRSGGR